MRTFIDRDLKRPVRTSIDKTRHVCATKKRRMLRIALGAAFLAASGSHSAAAQGIYASASDGIDTNFFFRVTPEGAGGNASNFGHILLNQGPATDNLPFTAMTAVDGQLKATSVSGGGAFNYFSDVTPRTPFGAYTSNSGQVTEFSGDALAEPVSEMAVYDDRLWGTSWSGSFNYFYELDEDPSGFGAVASFFGGITLGEHGRYFGYAIDTMAELDGQLYGTAFDGTQSLFFRINPYTDGTSGAWIDGLGALRVGGVPDTGPIDAMVGTPDGLYATSWNVGNQFNYLFKIIPDSAGLGGYETDTGELTLDGSRIPFRVNALGYLATAPAQGGVPEPESWAMLLIGFGLAGTAYRAKLSPKPRIAMN
jgi:hypothetical protein